MKDMTKALRPVKRRMRARQAFLWAVYGALVAGGCLLLLRAACFLRMLPFAGVLACVFATGLPAIFALIAGLWPISDVDAARQADALGLKARAQTAVMLEGCDTPMARLQREDALRSLRDFEPAEKLKLSAPRFAWIGIAACAVLLGLSFLIPNPQTEKLRELLAFQKRMAEQADKLDQGAVELNTDAPETPELRKLLGDLALALRKSHEMREALSAVDEMERGIAAIQERNAKDALSALKGNGADELAQALASGDAEAAQSALESPNLPSQLSAASKDASGSSALALQAAAQALLNGNLSEALQSLQNAASGQCAACSQAQALASMARGAAAGVWGSESTSGRPGGGASKGTSNRDGGVSAGTSGSVRGNAAPEKKTADYETIYDPTRLGGAGETVNAATQAGEGEQTETQLGTGMGMIDGAVPYRQALPQYTQTAVEAAQNANLPAYAQQWVENYFSALAGE